MIDLNQVEAELTARKDAYWARKVVFVCGFKIGLKAMQREGDEATVNMLCKLIATDVLKDMVEHYPNKDKMELSQELVNDSEELVTKLVSEAMGMLGDPGKDLPPRTDTI